MKTLRLTFRLLLALHIAPLQAAEPVTEIIPSARAAELAPVLAQLAGPGGSVSAYREQLVIRATPEKLAEIRRLLETLDRPLRNLQVVVRRGGGQIRSDQQAGARGQVVVTEGSTRLSASVQLQDSRQHTAQDDRYQLRTVEGSTVFIATGQDVPVLTVLPTPGGAVAGQAYVPAQSGVQVTPRLLADGQVLLDIEFVESRVEGASIGRQGARTQITLPPGQWAPFARIETRKRQNGSGITSRQSGETLAVTPLEIMVELLP